MDRGNNILDVTPKAQATKWKINKQNYNRPKIFRTAEVKKQSKEWEKILRHHMLHKCLISKIHKDLKQLSSQKKKKKKKKKNQKKNKKKKKKKKKKSQWKNIVATIFTKISGLISLKMGQTDIVCLLIWCTCVMMMSKCIPWICSSGNIRLIPGEELSTNLAYILQKCQYRGCLSMVISIHLSTLSFLLA